MERSIEKGKRKVKYCKVRRGRREVGRDKRQKDKKKGGNDVLFYTFVRSSS